jgi:prophage maintenance system killer protein
MESNQLQVMDLKQQTTSLKKKVWIYDVEQFPNFHCCTFMDRDDTEDIRQFVIYNEDQNDTVAYYEFLKNEVSGLIGFNNVNYDYPMIHFFMSLIRSNPDLKERPDSLNMFLYEESHRVIKAEYSAIYEKNVKIPQLDLFRIHHFDNKNKRTSLKAVEIAINFENVQDIPFDESHDIVFDEVDSVLEYNLNDVTATRKFYLLTVDMIDMRKRLGNRYGINLRNANDPKIGQEIFGRQIARKKGFQYRYLREMRTYRHTINIGECILPYIQFQSKEFSVLLEDLKQTEITTTYDAFEKSVIYKGARYDYGTGGIHGCIQSGIYEEDELYTIIDIDVKSYYPNLAIRNNFYPHHLGPEFVQVYSELFEQRLQAQRDGDKATNSGLKLALNGACGKSNDKYSLFYDPKFFITITVNGQLLLSMLAEKIVDNIPTAEILQANTDGITIRILRSEHNNLIRICEWWETLTSLTLEYATYSKMVIRDVNNYLAVTVEGKAKYKGCFEIIPMQNGAIAYNKDWSMRVVAKALDAYYRFGTPINEFIRNHRDIYDFCLGFRARKEWNLYRIYIDDNTRKEQKLQRTIRYYISTPGDSLIKIDENGHGIQLEAGYASTLFNQYEEKDWDSYKINYNYYISQANKIKNAVYDGQLIMF